MNLSVGIVGLPNVGKSTLFNALLKKQLAYVANFPFATIEPNIGVVPVPDSRLQKLADVVKESEKLNSLPPLVPSTVKFVDIAGLIKGAHSGEGLGNKFLAHIREVSAVCHVVRAFSDENIIKQGVVSPKDDLETVITELIFADLETLQKQKDPGNTPDKDERKRWQVIVKLKEALGKGIQAKEVLFNEEELKQVRQLSLLTAKPILIMVNIDESDLSNISQLEEKYATEFNLTKDQIICLCAKVEAELAALSDSEQIEYLKSYGITDSGLERLIKKAFKTLGLISFLTAGEIEVRSWTIRAESSALMASSAIHTDFAKFFIKADVIQFEQFIKYGGWVNAREKGLVSIVGKDYLMKDGEVVEFKIGK